MLAPLLALALSCGKPYDYVNGDPRLKLNNNKRMAQVGTPYEFGGMLTGRMPSPDQPVMMVLKVDGNERAIGIGNLYSRMIPAPNRVFVIQFTAMDYYEAMGRLRNEGLRTRLAGVDEPSNVALEDEGSVTIIVEIWLVEPHPTDPTKWVRGSRYVHGRHVVKLSCPHCVY
jgi:hypothetical protein